MVECPVCGESDTSCNWHGRERPMHDDEVLDVICDRDGYVILYDIPDGALTDETK